MIPPHAPAPTPDADGDHDASDPRPPPSRRYRVLMCVEAPLAGLVGMSCRDFARLTVAAQDRPLRSGERLRRRLHGVMCTVCRGFAAQFDTLNELLRETSAEPPPAAVVPPGDSDAQARIAARVRAALNAPETPEPGP